MPPQLPTALPSPEFILKHLLYFNKICSLETMKTDFKGYKADLGEGIV